MMSWNPSDEAMNDDMFDMGNLVANGKRRRAALAYRERNGRLRFYRILVDSGLIPEFEHKSKRQGDIGPSQLETE